MSRRRLHSGSEGRGRCGHALAAVLALLVSGPATAQVSDDRYLRPPAGVTGSIAPSAGTPGAPPWSGEPGSSRHPLMMPDAIRAAAANFRGCLDGLWPLAARRGVSRQTFDAHTAGLEPDL